MNDLIELHLDDVRVEKPKSQYQKDKRHINYFLDFLDEREIKSLEDVTVRDIERWAKRFRNDFAWHTTQSAYYSIKSMFDSLHKDEKIDENPFHHPDCSISKFIKDSKKYTEQVHQLKKKEKRDVDVISIEESEVLEVAENAVNPFVRNNFIIKTQFATGMRASDLVTIEIDDIIQKQRRIKYFSKKTGEVVNTYYPPSLDISLKNWIERERQSLHPSLPSENDYLFPSTRNEEGHLSANRVNDIVRESAYKAGLNEVLSTDAAGRKRHKITSHTLRHSFARHNLINGMDIKRCAEMMGDDVQTVADTYLDTKEEDVRDAYHQYGPKLSSFER